MVWFIDARPIYGEEIRTKRAFYSDIDKQYFRMGQILSVHDPLFVI